MLEYCLFIHFSKDITKAVNIYLVLLPIALLIGNYLGTTKDICKCA